MAQKLVSEAVLHVTDDADQDTVLHVHLWETSQNNEIFSNGNGRQGDLEIIRDANPNGVGASDVSQVSVYIPEDAFDAVADLLHVVFTTLADLQQAPRPQVRLSDLIKVAASFGREENTVIDGASTEKGIPSCGDCTQAGANQASGGPNDTQGFNYTKDGAQPI